MRVEALQLKSAPSMIPPPSRSFRCAPMCSPECFSWVARLVADTGSERAPELFCFLTASL
eukprot:scaffold34310_cov31-Tisochrysis_lutea.AAC.3